MCHAFLNRALVILRSEQKTNHMLNYWDELSSAHSLTFRLDSKNTSHSIRGNQILKNKCMGLETTRLNISMLQRKLAICRASQKSRNDTMATQYYLIEHNEWSLNGYLKQYEYFKGSKVNVWFFVSFKIIDASLTLSHLTIMIW